MIDRTIFFTLSAFLFQVIHADPSLKVDVTFKDCSPKETVILQGKCSLYVNDLMALTEDVLTDNESNKISLEEAKNISNICQSVTSCFGGIECAEAQKNQATYQRKCEKLDFHNYAMGACMGVFYQKVFDKKDNCTGDFDYFSKDMKIKRDAYTSGKACFMEIVKKNCSASANYYLDVNYEKFLDILTIPSDGDKCNSLHDEIVARQCEPEIKNLAKSAVEAKMRSMFGMARRGSSPADACKSVKNCMDNYCFFDQNIEHAIDEICDKMNKSIVKDPSMPVGFMMCYIEIVTDAVDSEKPNKEYECKDQYGPKPRNISDASSNYLKFLTDKDCIKTVMSGECGKSALLNFDKDWDETIVKGLGKAKNSTGTPDKFLDKPDQKSLEL